jgi:hypothetical protein
MTDVNPESCAVDEHVNRLTRREPRDTDATEVLQTSRQSRVVGDWEIDLEDFAKATKESLGLAKRKVKDHAHSQCGLDRNITVGALATRLALGRNSPGIARIVRKPDRQVTTPLQTGFLLRPVPYPILRLRVLVLASLRILHSVAAPGAMASCHFEI